MTQIKLSAQQEANQARDREFGYELGFFKFCQDQKLTKEAAEALYNEGMRLLSTADKPKA